MRRSVMAFVLAVLMAVGGAVVPAQAALDDVLHVEGAWARPGLQGGTSAVYFTLHHHGEEPVRFVDAHSDVAATVELHETTFAPGPGGTGQVMRMQRIDGLDVVPGDVVSFSPGGLHVMLIGLHQGLKIGDSFDLVLETASGESLSIVVPVAATGPGTGDVDHHHDHDHDHHH